MFGAAFEEPEHYCDKRPSAAYLEKLLGQDHFIALAAMNEGEVVGGLVAYVLQKFEQERSEIYIYDIAVDKRHRRKGIATALISKVRTIGAERDTHVIYIQADKGDEAPTALYSKLGTREEVLHFDIEVE